MPTVPACVNVALLLGPLLANLGFSFFTAHVFLIGIGLAIAILIVHRILTRKSDSVAVG